MNNHSEIKDFDVFYVHYEGGVSIAGLRLARRFGIPSVQVMHGREDMGEANIVPFGFKTIVAVLLNWFHSWYLPHKTKVEKDDYLANTLSKAKMWTLMVNHANFADLVITPSEHFRKKLLDYGVSRPIKVFPNGFPDANFPKNPPLRKLKKGEEMRIIWHSRISGEKRIMPFLQALKDVKGKYRFDAYGGGGELEKAKRFSKKHNLNAIFHGFAKFDVVQKAISESHLDVLVSHNFDTFGMTLIEAEVAGVPVFFCDPDMKEVVPTRSYVMSRDESPRAMADALNDLLEHPEKIQKMSEVFLTHREEVLISRRISILERFFEEIIRK